MHSFYFIFIIFSLPSANDYDFFFFFKRGVDLGNGEDEKYTYRSVCV